MKVLRSFYFFIFLCIHLLGLNVIAPLIGGVLENRLIEVCSTEGYKTISIAQNVDHDKENKSHKQAGVKCEKCFLSSRSADYLPVFTHYIFKKDLNFYTWKQEGFFYKSFPYTFFSSNTIRSRAPPIFS